MADYKRLCLTSRPVGMPTDEDFTVETLPIPEPGDGELVVRIEYVSLDPAMRGWMRDVRSYMPPVALGDVMRAGAVGEVVASRNDRFAVGSFVVGTLGVQQYALSDGKGLAPVDPDVAPLPAYLGVLGMPGMTAYFGLLEVGALKDGDTVLVSGAAGAVGSIVGQIAKNKGAGLVVGLAGSDAKCRHLTEDLGFDAAINYKTEDVRARVYALCPKGIDVYFDNVGGEILDIALGNIARGGRVAICGAISQYNNAAVTGPKNYLALLVQRARMEGFLVFDFKDRYAEGMAVMAGWLAADMLHYRETVVEGIEAFPQAFERLFTGEKLGKLVLKVG